MSAAISLVPAATTLQDMRSRGPPGKQERRQLCYGSLHDSLVRQLLTDVCREKIAHRPEIESQGWDPTSSQEMNLAGDSCYLLCPSGNVAKAAPS